MSNEFDAEKGSRRSEEAKKLAANVKELDATVHQLKAQCEKVALGVIIDFKELQQIGEKAVMTLGIMAKRIAVIAAIDGWDGRT